VVTSTTAKIPLGKSLYPVGINLFPRLPAFMPTNWWGNLKVRVLLITRQEDKEGQNIKAYILPFSGKPADLDSANISVTRPDGKEINFRLPSLNLNGQRYLIHQGNPSSEIALTKLLRSPKKTEYAFNGDFGLPFSSGLWLWQDGCTTLLTPLEINGLRSST